MIIFVTGAIKNQKSVVILPTKGWQKKFSIKYQDCVVYFKLSNENLQKN